MIMQMNGDTLKVDFVYYAAGDGSVETTARIRHLEADPDDCAEGFSWCRSGDNFSKKKGRKLALRRVLGEIYTREDRKKFWPQYFNQTNELKRRNK